MNAMIPQSKINADSGRTSSSRSVCAHCGLDVPTTTAKSESDKVFCCAGCELAFQLIHDFGLDAFYDMNQTEGTAVGEVVAAEQFADFDSCEFQAQFATADAGGSRRIRFGIQGIHCIACVWLIEKLPQMQRGVVQARVNWSNSTLDLHWDPSQTKLSEAVALLRRLGYRLSAMRYGERERQNTIETRTQLMRLGIAGAAAGNNMLIALGLYLGWFSGMELGYQSLLRYASCFLGLVSLLGPGMVFFRSAWQALRMRTPHMDLPIALGLAAGGIGGLVNTIRGEGEIYFDSLGVLVFLLLVGRFIQFRQQLRSADAVDLLYQLTPRKARKIVNGVPIDTHADLLKVGDVVQVLAGELIPADGKILEGQTTIDEAILTGESAPRRHCEGSLVAAGTLNLGSAIVVSVSAVGEESRVGRIARLVAQAAADKPAIVQWANRIGGQFVIAVIILALATIAIWWNTGWLDAVDRAIALLIVACPCALAMATPLALAIGLGRGAQRGILIKGGDVLQRLNQPGTIWLDKTGTVTQGSMRLVNWTGENRWLWRAAAIQDHSSHPIAAAMNCNGVNNFLGQRGMPSIENYIAASQVEQTANGGIRGWSDGKEILIGNRQFVLQAAKFDDRFENAAAAALQDGLTPVFVASSGQVVGVAAVGDPIRPEARTKIAHFKKLGWRVGMLSGDHPVVVGRIAEHLGIDPALVRGGMLPEDKVAFLRQQPTEQTQVMVGDGVNDSAALAVASVGVAVHGGSEVSMQAAPVYLNRPGLEPILELLDLSRNTMQTIRLNLTVSMLYNALAVVLAMAGIINPLIAALLMPISSLTVVSSSWLRPSFSSPSGNEQPVDRNENGAMVREQSAALPRAI
jgi:P-type Cu2+ transporter